MSETDIDHPPTKMSISLESVDAGWQRVFRCWTCGKVKLGSIGKTLTIKGCFYCNGRSVKKKPQEEET